MSDHITVTGNEAQFNENVTFLKNVFIGEGLDIHGVFNSHGNSNLNDVASKSGIIDSIKSSFSSNFFISFTSCIL